MTELLNIGLSGLNSSRISLRVAGHNVTNANVEGYSRQSAELGTRPTEFLGGFYLGTGVEVEAVRRITNSFLVAGLRSDTSVYAGAETLSTLMDQLDQLFSNSNSGLSGNMSSFFSSLQTAVDNPGSIEARQVFLSSAEGLTQKFNSLHNQLLVLQRDIGLQVEAVAQQATSYTREIADLNAQIAIATNSGSNPNDLLDKREQALNKLAELVNISVIPTDNNGVTVSVGNGQPLVVGTEAFELTTLANPDNPSQRELAIRSVSGAVSPVGNGVSGGMLGGLLSVKGEVIDDALNNLGRIALGVSGSLNVLHNLGMDLEGNLGGDLFTDINDANSVANRTTANGGNSLPQDQVVSVSISDVNQLTTSDYQLDFTGANTYVLTRVSDGVSNAALDPSLTGSLGALPATVTVDGMTITLDRPSGAFAAGDRFLIQPTRGFADEIALQVDRAQEVALASPIRTTTNASNTGNAAISAGEVTDKSTPFFAAAGQLSPPVTIRFTSPTSYDILDNSNPSAPVALAPPQTGLTYPPVAPNGILPTSFGFQVDITGTPAAGDSFSVDYNAGGVLDNRVGLAMVGVQTSSVLENGSMTLESAYGVFTQEIGTRTSTARNNLEASQTLLEQSQAMLQSVAGVNLDEEAARLVEFEQAYNASAQVINVARSIFDTLLSALRG